MIGKQILYIAAVVVVMIIASRYMKKIKDRPDEAPEEDQLLSGDESPSDEAPQPEIPEADETSL
jgi:hypothetical protein